MIPPETKPLSPEELDELVDETDSWRGRAAIIVDRLIATIRAAWQERDDACSKYRTRYKESLMGQYRAGLEEAAKVVEEFFERTVSDYAPVFLEVAEAIRALKETSDK